MAHFHDNALIGASGQGGYQIERSLRFNSADSAYLNRTPASAGNRRTFTWSGWFKVGNHSSSGEYYLLCTNGTADNTFFYIQIRNNQLRLGSYNSGSFGLFSTQLFRDPSAWYHLVVAVDTTQVTAANRAKAYVNGTEITTWSTANYPSQNYDLGANDARAHAVGAGYASGSPYAYWDGLLTECHLIDGQALTPSSFGETDTITGVWKPKKYAGTYGTNGFYLKFADNSGTTSTTLGKDSSGNGNNWTPNNFSVTAGAGNDSLIDTPTPYADGGNGRGNYATLNTLRLVGSNGSLTNGNLENSGGGNPARAFPSTIAVSTGKFYAEFALTSNNYTQVGAVDSTLFPYSSGAVRGSGAITWELSTPGSLYYVNSASGSGSPPSPAGGDVIMVAIDATTRKVWFGRNGTWNGSGDPAAGTNEIGTLNGTDAISFFVRAESTTITANFGQRDFAYTPPSGFLALNTQNLPEPSIKKSSSYMDVKLYTGNGGTQTISGLGFSPDLVWIKIRNTAGYHNLFDTVRGAGKFLISNTTSQELGNSGDLLGAFNSDGFSVNTTYVGGFGGSTNNINDTYVAWCWDESATPGFDIVTYTGTGSATTVAHSLGVDPKLGFIKRRDSTSDWSVYYNFDGLGAGVRYLTLNSTAASVYDTTYWNSSVWTSTLMQLGTNGAVNTNSATYVAYLWSEVAGFSKFGSYTGNGSTDGPFVFCGFRPRWIMFKSTTLATDWIILDAARDPYNQQINGLGADISNAENASTLFATDALSNGFKLRTSWNNFNQSGQTFIFAAFAESPQKYSLAR